MPDNPPAQPVKPKKLRAPRGPIDAADLAELSLDEKVAGAVVKPEFAAAFAKHKLPATVIPGFVADVKLARKQADDAIAGTSGRQTATRTEAGNKAELIAAIHDIQKLAKEKYESEDPNALGNYYVGVRFESSRALLEQAANGIYSRVTDLDDAGNAVVPPDDLPGMDAAKILRLRKARAAYLGIELVQAKAGGDASGGRTSLKQKLAKLKPVRRKVQRIIDSEFPHTDPANAGTREMFGLQGDRGMA